MKLFLVHEAVSPLIQGHVDQGVNGDSSEVRSHDCVIGGC